MWATDNFSGLNNLQSSVKIFNSHNLFFYGAKPTWSAVGYCQGKLSIRLSVYPSIRLSVTLRYRNHIGWNSAKIISRLISLTISRSAGSNMTDLVQREHPQILAVIGVGMENCRSSTFKPPYLWNGARYGPSCHWPLIGICIRAFDWYQNRWTWSNDLWARFKVIDSLNAAKMAK